MENNINKETENCIPATIGNEIKIFAERLKEKLLGQYGEQYNVEVKEVMKNNGVCPIGLCITEKEWTGTIVSPVLYLDGYYRQYQSGRDEESICREIMGLREQCQGYDGFDITALADFGKSKDKVCYRLINAEANEKLLATLPHRKYLDMAVIYYLEVERECDTTATMKVTNDVMATWRTDEETLYRLASANTPEILGYSIMTLLDKMKSIAPMDDEIVAALEQVAENQPEMFVATNQITRFGAVTMLYDELLKWFAERTGGDYIILPSSIHELIFVPMQGALAGISTEEMAQMVREINATVVDAEEVLSDHVYRYCATENCVKIVA